MSNIVSHHTAARAALDVSRLILGRSKQWDPYTFADFTFGVVATTNIHWAVLFRPSSFFDQLVKAEDRTLVQHALIFGSEQCARMCGRFLVRGEWDGKGDKKFHIKTLFATPWAVRKVPSELRDGIEESFFAAESQKHTVFVDLNHIHWVQ